jgi:hypothetical protein
MKRATGDRVVRIVLVILGSITTMPVLALLWPSTLDVSYGLGIQPDPMVDSLLRHRGVLQAALGAALIWAAFRPDVRVPAAVTAITTKSTFLLLIAALPAEKRSDAMLGIVFDLAAIVILGAIVFRHLHASRARPTAATNIQDATAP